MYFMYKHLIEFLKKHINKQILTSPITFKLPVLSSKKVGRNLVFIIIFIRVGLYIIFQTHFFRAGTHEGLFLPALSRVRTYNSPIEHPKSCSLIFIFVTIVFFFRTQGIEKIHKSFIFLKRMSAMPMGCWKVQARIEKDGKLYSCMYIVVQIVPSLESQRIECG